MSTYDALAELCLGLRRVLVIGQTEWCGHLGRFMCAGGYSVRKNWMGLIGLEAIYHG